MNNSKDSDHGQPCIQTQPRISLCGSFGAVNEIRTIEMNAQTDGRFASPSARSVEWSQYTPRAMLFPKRQ